MTELTNLKIARNMACIVGCDLSFKYRENYLEYIRRSFGKGFVKPLIAEGVDAAERRDMEYACICFRAATLIDPDDAPFASPGEMPRKFADYDVSIPIDKDLPAGVHVEVK